MPLLDFFVAVMYAPCIGAVGFDLSRMCSRRMFAESRNAQLNEPIPLYPEISGYAVCQIKKGMIRNLIYLIVGIAIEINVQFLWL